MARVVSPKPDKTAPDAPPPEETKVFLSYSRKDAATLHQIGPDFACVILHEQQGQAFVAKAFNHC